MSREDDRDIMKRLLLAVSADLEASEECCADSFGRVTLKEREGVREVIEVSPSRG